MDDEIDLVDLWLVICRNRLWLLAGLLIGTILAIAYVALAPSLYESRASIQIGNVPGSGLDAVIFIEDPNVLSVELLNEYGKKYANGAVRKTYLDKKGVKVHNNILDLTAVGYRPEESRDLLEHIVGEIMQRHQLAYKNAIDPLKQRVAAIDKQIAILTTQMKELGDLVTRLKESNPVQASLVALERGHLYASLDQLERDRVDLQQQSSTPYVNPTQVIVQPEISEDSVSPHWGIMIAIGVFFGFALGLVAIFVKQFLASVRDASNPGKVRNP